MRDSFSQQICTKRLQQARDSCRSWRYHGEKKTTHKLLSCLMGEANAALVNKHSAGFISEGAQAVR